jgi:hypothetical protein
MEDTRLVEGIVIDKDFSHPQVGGGAPNFHSNIQYLFLYSHELG